VYFVSADHLGSTLMLTCFKQGSSCADRSQVFGLAVHCDTGHAAFVLEGWVSLAKINGDIHAVVRDMRTPGVVFPTQASHDGVGPTGGHGGN